MAAHCIVIADDSDEGSDESLPPFSQTSMGVGEVTCSQAKRAYSGQEEVTPSKKTARPRASPEYVYDLTASPRALSPSRASSTSSNDRMQVEKRPLSSTSVESSSGSKQITAGSDAVSSVDSHSSVTVSAKEAAKKKRAMDREALRKQKQQQKKIDQAMKKATRETQKELTRDERVKQMIVLLDVSLSENPSFIAELSTQLKDLGVTYRVSSMEPSGSVRWKRKVTDRTVDDSAQVIRHVREEDLPHLILTLEGTGFLSLVHCSKQEMVGGERVPHEGRTLVQFVDEMQSMYPGVKLTLALEGLQASLRNQKTQKSRQFREAVRQQQTAANLNSITPLSGVTKVDCQEALVSLQLAAGCCVRMCEEPAELARLVVTYTKALADLPFVKEHPFDFYANFGPGVSRQVLSDSDNQLAEVWQQQLMQFSNVSTPVAAAIAGKYSSPASLMKAYKSCESTKDAELLLQDIQVRRGVGVTSSTRRVGPVTSKRIHQMMTSKERNLALH